MVYLTANFETDIQIGQVGSGQTAAAEVIPHLPVKAFQALHQPGQIEQGACRARLLQLIAVGGKEQDAP